ncbi:MAG: DNA methyltransferase [Pseudonocardiaceae bacterium]
MCRTHSPQQQRCYVPHGGLSLIPFCGSGSTGTAALLEGHQFIGIELSRHYAEQAATPLDTTQTYPAHGQP